MNASDALVRPAGAGPLRLAPIEIRESRLLESSSWMPSARIFKPYRRAAAALAIAALPTTMPRRPPAPLRPVSW